MTPFKIQALLTVAVLCAAGAAQANWVALDYPGASFTQAFGVHGDNIVGMYSDHTGDHGFLYDGITWTPLDFPGAVGHTVAFGVDGENIVGEYTDASNNFHGFLFDGTTWTTLDFPGAGFTCALGIEGDNIVGGYAYEHNPASSGSGYHYDGTIWTPLPAGAAFDVYADKMVCIADVGMGGVGMMYDGTAWTVFGPPGASQSDPLGIDGNNVVGTFVEDSAFHGYLYDGVTWTKLDFPGATYTSALGVGGKRIVGIYGDSAGTHGFIYTIPEPATLLLLGLGGLMLRKRRQA